MARTLLPVAPWAAGDRAIDANRRSQREVRIFEVLDIQTTPSGTVNSW